MPVEGTVLKLQTQADTEAQISERSALHASLEELVAGVATQSVTTSGISQGLFVAPFPCLIVAGFITQGVSTLVQSDADYWTLSLRRHHHAGAGALVTSTMVAKTTRLSDGEMTYSKVDWNFNTRAWANNLLAEGDVVDLLWTKTGAPAAWGAGLAQIRYQPT